MEVGAVKQAFNNEVILLKKKLNQAKIQIIHKLTRKAKQLTEKKTPEQLKEKLKRKAESAVKEVLIIKKIKAKDIAKFIVTHKGELNSYLNKPQIDEDKACARLLLHKALQDKHKFIRDRFSNVPIQDLFMSRLERRKMKKEAKEKQKNKKKGNDKKVVNSEGNWDVEDVAMADSGKLSGGDDDDDDDDDYVKSGDEDDVSSDENVDNEVSGESDHSEMDSDENDDSQANNIESDNGSESYEGNTNEKLQHVGKLEKIIPKEPPFIGGVKSNTLKNEGNKTNPPKETIKKNPIKKQKESNKNKNFNDKILQRKFKKDTDSTVVGNKIVDPFFITATGENYMSVVEPRAPDEIKKEHMQGNRKLRRAVMFGHVPKSKLRQNNNYYNEDKKFNKFNGNEKGNDFKGKFNDRTQFNDKRNFNNGPQYNDRNNFNDRKPFNNRNDKSSDEKPEKLHPSWEAKKKKSGILPFEGKKIVFDES